MHPAALCLLLMLPADAAAAFVLLLRRPAADTGTVSAPTSAADESSESSTTYLDSYEAFIQAFTARDTDAILSLMPPIASTDEKAASEIRAEYAGLFEGLENDSVECACKCVSAIRFGGAEKETLREDDLWLYEEIEETGILPYEVYFFYLKLTVPDGETYGVLTIAADADGRAYILFLESITPEIYENAQSGFRSY